VASTQRETQLDYRNRNLRGVFRQDFGWLDGRLYLGVDAILSTEDDDTYNRVDFTRGTLRDAYHLQEKNIAPFAELSLSPLDKLRLTGGLRYETFKIDIDDRSPGGDRDGVREYNSLIAKFGATYELNQDHRLWVNVSEGYYLPNTSQTLTGVNARDLPPEDSLTYQVGLRGASLDNLFGYDAAFYRTTIKGQGLNLLCGGDATLCPEVATDAATYPAAAGEVRYQGIETSAFYQISEALRFSFAYTYARNEFVDFVDSSGDYSGNFNAQSPKHHLNARVQIRPIAGLQAEIEADYLSAYFTNTANTDRYRRPVLTNLHASYEVTPTLKLHLSILNLFDVRYADRISATNEALPVRTYNEGHQPFMLRAGITARW
jgi:iron complex outermembrane receptor protein